MIHRGSRRTRFHVTPKSSRSRCRSPLCWSRLLTIAEPSRRGGPSNAEDTCTVPWRDDAKESDFRPPEIASTARAIRVATRPRCIVKYNRSCAATTERRRRVTAARSPGLRARRIRSTGGGNQRTRSRARPDLDSFTDRFLSREFVPERTLDFSEGLGRRGRISPLPASLAFGKIFGRGEREC